MPQPIVHVEFAATNHAEAAQWYANQFGWKTEKMSGAEYTTATFSDEAGMGAGFCNISETAPAGRVIAQIMVENLDAQIASIRAAGGEIMSEPAHVPGVGTWCLFKDPSGNIVGIIQPETV